MSKADEYFFTVTLTRGTHAGHSAGVLEVPGAWLRHGGQAHETDRLKVRCAQDAAELTVMASDTDIDIPGHHSRMQTPLAGAAEVITRQWSDPCPRCGRQVQDFSADIEYVTDNPDAVLSVRNPACPHDPDDPDSPDCICTTIINPAPDPWLDRQVPVAARVTFTPCGDEFHVAIHKGGRWGSPLAGWKMYRQDVPEPGSLGELMADWAREDT